VDRLSGKVAVVTGAASSGEGVGNGAATAILFAREGAKVVLVNRSPDRAKILEEQIRSEGGDATAFPADITQPNTVEAMAAFAVERYGRLISCTTTSASRHPARRRRSISKNGTASSKQT
jgi:NAD(P)-dependent dehydrogenase (short-subunit alcohol dehydrogenase family)